jgi:hypothetical protein
MIKCAKLLKFNARLLTTSASCLALPSRTPTSMLLKYPVPCALPLLLLTYTCMVVAGEALGAELYQARHQVDRHVRSIRKQEQRVRCVCALVFGICRATLFSALDSNNDYLMAF